MLDERIRVFGTLVVDRNADTRGDMNLVVVDAVRLVEHGQRPLGHGERLRRFVDAGQQHYELVAAHAGQCVAGREYAGKTPRHRV